MLFYYLVFVIRNHLESGSTIDDANKTLNALQSSFVQKIIRNERC